MTPVILGIAAVLAIALVGLVLRRRTRPTDGVEQFQRQIDALSPAARRPVVDRVQQLETTPAPDEDADDDDDADTDPAAPDGRDGGAGAPRDDGPGS